MLGLLKKLFGAKPAVSESEAPYKVETPQTTVGTVPMSTQYEQATEAVVKSVAKKPAGVKKPAVKTRTTRAKKKSS